MTVNFDLSEMLSYLGATTCAIGFMAIVALIIGAVILAYFAGKSQIKEEKWK
jgi:hypothetical protein